MIRNAVALLSGFTVLSIVCSSGASEILQCYSCVEAKGPDFRHPRPVCSQLKDAPEYKILCPNSTMCQKTVTTMILENQSERTTVLRGCANQVNIRQELRNNIYKDVAVIEEPFKNGCIERKSDDMLTVTVKECYCRGSLCNASTHVGLNKSIYIIYAMFLLISIQSLIGN